MGQHVWCHCMTLMPVRSAKDDWVNRLSSVQGPGCRQRRRHSHRPQHLNRQSTRCTNARSGNRASQTTGKGPQSRHRRSGLWRRLLRKLTRLGVSKVVIPRKGRPNADRRAIQKRRSFQKLVRWRSEKQGSTVSNVTLAGHGRDSTASKERDWCGHGVFNHNLVKIATLVSFPMITIDRRTTLKTGYSGESVHPVRGFGTPARGV